MKIHISSDTAAALNKWKTFQIKLRGEVDMKVRACIYTVSTQYLHTCTIHYYALLYYQLSTIKYLHLIREYTEHCGSKKQETICLFWE